MTVRVGLALGAFVDRIQAGELGPRERAALADLVLTAADAVERPAAGDPAGAWGPVQQQVREILRMAGS